MEYHHYRNADIVTVEIEDADRRKLYKRKFNINDKNAILIIMGVLEKFSGFNVKDLLKLKLELGDKWW